MVVTIHVSKYLIYKNLIIYCFFIPWCRKPHIKITSMQFAPNRTYFRSFDHLRGILKIIYIDFAYKNSIITKNINNE